MRIRRVFRSENKNLKLFALQFVSKISSYLFNRRLCYSLFEYFDKFSYFPMLVLRKYISESEHESTNTLLFELLYTATNV